MSTEVYYLSFPPPSPSTDNTLSVFYTLGSFVIPLATFDLFSCTVWMVSLVILFFLVWKLWYHRTWVRKLTLLTLLFTYVLYTIIYSVLVSITGALYQPIEELDKPYSPSLVLREHTYKQGTLLLRHDWRRMVVTTEINIVDFLLEILLVEGINRLTCNMTSHANIMESYHLYQKLRGKYMTMSPHIFDF